MPAKITKYWIYPLDGKYSNPLLAKLLDSGKDFHEEVECADGQKRPMWNPTIEVLEAFESQARQRPDLYSYVVYLENEANVRRPRGERAGHGSNLKLVDHDPPPVRRLKPRRRAS